MQVILIYCRRQKRFSISWLFSCKNWHITFIANLAWKITLITSYITIRSVTTFSNPVYYKCDLQHKFWMTHVIDPSTYAGNKRWKKKTYYKDIEVFKVRAFFFRTNVTIWERTCVNDVRNYEKTTHTHTQSFHKIRDGRIYQSHTYYFLSSKKPYSVYRNNICLKLFSGQRCHDTVHNVPYVEEYRMSWTECWNQCLFFPRENSGWHAVKSIRRFTVYVVTHFVIYNKSVTIKTLWNTIISNGCILNKDMLFVYL